MNKKQNRIKPAILRGCRERERERERERGIFN